MSHLPIFIASAAQGGTGGFTLAVPTGTLPGDIVVAFVQTAAQTFTIPADFTEFPDSPQSIGTAGAAGSTRLVACYRRQTEATTSGFAMPDSGNRNHVLLITFRGVIEAGDPWDVTSGGSEASDTSLSATGDTTTVANCLVVVCATNATDTVAPNDQYGSWANADLASLSSSSSAFSQSDAGVGGGLSVAIGTKVTAGSFGATTATLVNASAKNFITIALKPALGPWLFGIGTQNGQTVGQAYSWAPAGTYQTNDVALLLLETANEAVTTPSGWGQVTNSPQGTGTGGAGGATRLTVLWRRATSGSESDVTIADPGDHQIGTLLVFRNVITSGDPWDQTSGGVKSSGSTSTSIAGVTTTVTDTLVMYATTRDDDTAATTFGSWANASVANFGEIVQFGLTVGNGGGLAAATGYKATAAATGTATATSSATIVEGFMCIALKPDTGAVAVVTRFYATIIG